MISRDEGVTLLKRYNKEEFHIHHGLTLEACMRYFAQKLGYEAEADYWAMVGLLHDIDFEMWPEEHCVRCVELLKEAGFDDGFIHSVCSHGYGMTGSQHKPEHEMEKVLFAVDELTGLIGAYALMRPDKSVKGMEVISLKKKFKDKKFAAGCSRDVISQGAEMLGVSLDDLMADTIKAMEGME